MWHLCCDDATVVAHYAIVWSAATLAYTELLAMEGVLCAFYGLNLWCGVVGGGGGGGGGGLSNSNVHQRSFPEHTTRIVQCVHTCPLVSQI